MAAHPRGPLLVTGASGFLGRHVLETLQRGPEPRRVLALVRDEAAWRGLGWTAKVDRAEPIRGSVTEPAAWRDDPRLEGLSGVLHLAALVQHSRRADPALETTNVEGALRMVELAAERACRLVFVSTSGTVGCFRTPQEEADEASPFCAERVAGWPYYRSKLEAERQARRLADERGVELCIVRPPVLLGPGDHRLRSTSTLLRFLRRRLPILIRGGIHFADVRDVAAALVRLLEREQVRPVYHLPGTACSVERFFAMAEEISGVPATRWVLPFRPAHLLASGLDRLGLHWLPDPVVVEMGAHHWGLRSRYAEAELGYASRDPRETLRDTVAWLRANVPDLAAEPASGPGDGGPR